MNKSISHLVMLSITSVSNFLKHWVNKDCTNIIYYYFFFSVCHEVLTVNRSHGILESLNYPNNYPLNEHCNWTIQTTNGNTLNYSFRAFDLEDGTGCDRDFLKVCTQMLETRKIRSLPIKKNKKDAEDQGEIYFI